ncbi:unnamed protein product [Periconia digitata]|uniref:NB-ARC domain-containing protein n=1 Tax=Periconia digitata TaxID=1303443 RepID=A0A9W4UE97_9PLEO|nr:unnamed protein product [Periconia digitata]
MTETLDLEAYTVLLLCPLEVEAQAAELMLDGYHEGVHERAPGQNTIYSLGSIGCHNVAIASYPVGEVGIGVSGSMAAEALRDFPNLEIGFLIGIAAGIPSSTKDIRLGDVAVAIPTGDNAGVIGYDLVKVEDERIQLKQWQNSTASLLRALIRRMQVSSTRPTGNFKRHLEVLERAAAFDRPHPPAPSSEWPSHKPQRKPEDGPQVHYGTILSGNGVIKSKAIRDMLRDQHGGIAIEMEAAGMMTRLPVAVVRGISDFADASKNDEWQPYAALTAAAYAKEMLLKLGPLRKANAPVSEIESVISPDIHERLSLALPEDCRFVGRTKELEQLNSWLEASQVNKTQRSIVALWGLSGAGKSQLVSKFVKEQCLQHPDMEVFWVPSNSIESFEQGIFSLLKVHTSPSSTEKHEGHHEKRKRLVSTFFAELRSTSRPRWLLVIDALSNVQSHRDQIISHIKTLPFGSFIVTTTSKELADAYSHQLEIKGLPEEHAMELLRMEISQSFRQEKDILELAKMLKGLPLALRLATSILSRYPQPVSQYVKRWNSRELEYGNLPAHTTITQALEVSFGELENTNPLAARLLTLFSFLDHRDMWYDLVREAKDSDFPDWCRELAMIERFRECVILLCDLSFIEAKLDGQNECIYEIHPAIQDFARWKATDEEGIYVRCAISMVANKVPRSSDHHVLQIAQRLQPHVDQCMIHLKQDRAGSSLDLVELEKFGNLFRILGRYQEATSLYNMISHHLKDDKDSESTMATIENNLGLIYHAQQRYRLALESFRESSKWMFQLQGETNDAFMSTLYNQGRSLIMLSNLEAGQECLITAAQHFAKAFKDPQGSHRDEKLRSYYRVLNDLGETYLRENNLDAAERAFKEAFQGLGRLLHEMHPATFTVRLNMGRVCAKRSLFASARNIFKYVIETYTGWWGRRHPDTMRAIDELAHAYMQHGKAQRSMGDGGEREFGVAAGLWKEILQYYHETYGSSSELANSIKSRLHELQLLQVPIEDAYQVYYASGEFIP